NGLFRYDGKRTLRIEGAPTGNANSFLNMPEGLLLGAANGLFLYDGTRLMRVGGEPTGEIKSIHDAVGGPLVGADNGLFRYEGKRAIRIESEPTGSVGKLHYAQNVLLLSADNGLFQTVAQPLSTAKVILDNSSQLRGAAPNPLGVPTRWVITHPCAAFASQF